MFWIAAFFIGLICAAISGRITENKGRGQAVGFFAGLLLGPAGLIVALAVAPDQAVLDQRAVRSGIMKQCRMCFGAIPLAARACRHCGAAT